MEEAFIEILKKKNVLYVTGEPRPGKESCYERVKKLIRLHPDDPAWCEDVVQTAFTPNTQNSSFLDECLERGIVDEDYNPISEKYDSLLELWDDSPYTPFPRKKFNKFFAENYKENELPEPVFFNDDSECW